MNKYVSYFLLSLLTLLLALVCIEYLDLWRTIGIPHFKDKWFIDFHALVAAAECDAQGLNTFLTNPCDPFNRVHVYSRVWFLLDDLGISSNNFRFWGAVVSSTFVLTYLIILKPNNLWQLAVTTCLLLSPAVLLGIERANNDLIIFSLLALSCYLNLSQHKLNQLFSYILLVLSAAIKFYPLVAFCIYLFTSKSRVKFWIITTITTVLTLIVIAITYTDFQQMRLPTPSNRWTFGARYILQIPFPELPYFKIILACWLLIFIMAFVFTKTQEEHSPRKPDFKTTLFIIGSSISLFTFISANNYDYRCVFLLFCVPFLFERCEIKELCSNTIITILIMCTIVWWEVINQTTIELLSGNHKQHLLYLSVRWVEQLLTWVLMIRILWILMELLKAPVLTYFFIKSDQNNR